MSLPNIKLTNSMGVMAQDFGFRGDKYIRKKELSLLHTSSGPYLCRYQILTKYFKPLRSYGVHKNLALKFLQDKSKK